MSSPNLSVRIAPEVKARIAQLGQCCGGESEFVRAAIALADAVMTARELRAHGLTEDARRVRPVDHDIQRIIATFVNVVQNEHNPGGHRGCAANLNPLVGQKEARTT